MRRFSPAPTASPADSAGLAAVVGPSAVEVTPNWLRVGDGYAATLVITGLPTLVGPAWLSPLTSWPGRIDITQHISPFTGPQSAQMLRRQRARLESSRRLDADHGRLTDPATEAAAEDAADLADRVARGQSKLHDVATYVTIHATDLDELAEAVAHVRASAASTMLDTQPVTFRQLQGWTSTLPLGVDSLRMRRVMDTEALAAAFPLASADLPAPLPGEPAPAGGVLYGINPDSAGVVWWDRWAQHNHNSVVVARSGAGKSYFVKLEVLRSLADGVHVAVVDPEDEYVRLACAVDGTVLQLGKPGVRVNPLDIPPGDRRSDALVRRALFVHSLVAVLLAEQPSAAEQAALDTAIATAYAGAGISHDPVTWTLQAPLLRDVAAALAEQSDDAAAGLAARLAPWTTGSFKELFDGPTTTVPAGQLVVWSTRQLADELRAPGMLLALDAIWQDVDAAPARAGAAPRRLVIVDEAWRLLHDGEGARFLFRLSKQARKRRAGVSVVTQDAADLLGSQLGQAVIANAATQVLMRQAPQAIDEITEAFGLTTGEARALLSARRGEGILLAGAHRVSFQALASPAEHRLCVGDLDRLDDDDEEPLR
ncbi:VirB4 family type IV secretion system protein [Catellatospora methionotrophica]|uniref:VirB4 family type IV secretion system protein n=1 Tax=Catellatospora methionotrophica TaxID=121620 RepID=UPI003F4CDDE9